MPATSMLRPCEGGRDGFSIQGGNAGKSVVIVYGHRPHVASGYATIVTDPDGTIVEWGSGAERLFGWTRSEAVGSQIADEVLLRPTEPFATERIMQGLRAGRAWAGEVSGRHRDGGRFTAHIVEIPILDSRGELAAVVGLSADASRRVAAQRRQLAGDLRSAARIIRERLQPCRQLRLTVWDRSPQAAVIEASGELDLATTGEFRDGLSSVGPARALIVDFSDLSFVDATGVGVVLQRAERRPGGCVCLVVVSPRPSISRRLLDIVEAAGVLAITETVEQAILIQDLSLPGTGPLGLSDHSTGGQR